MWAIWVVVAAVVATLGLTPAARAAAVPGPAPWQGPVEVAHERGAQFSSVATALAADGHGIVVWASRAPRYAVSAVDVAPDGSLGRPVVLSSPADRASAPRVGMAADGEAIVAWHVGPRARGVSLCVRPASGGACAAQRVSLPGGRAILQSLAVDADGSAIVAWLQQTARGWRAAVAERAPGASFGRARLVGPAGATAADVALGPLSASLVFSRTPARRANARSGSEVRMASWLRGESPATAVARGVSPRGHVAVAPRVAVNDRDDAILAWERMHGVNEFAIAYARVRDCARVGCSDGPGALARLGALRRLGPPLVRRGPQASTSALTVSAAGRRLVAAWTHLPGDERSPSQIRVAQWSGGTLGAPVTVSDRAYSGFDPQVVARGQRTVVIFREYGRPGVRDGLVVARVAHGGALGFGALAGLSSPALIQQSGSRPRVALGPSGAALAVFTDYGADGSGAGQVSLARLPASG